MTNWGPFISSFKNRHLAFPSAVASSAVVATDSVAKIAEIVLKTAPIVVAPLVQMAPSQAVVAGGLMAFAPWAAGVAGLAALSNGVAFMLKGWGATKTDRLNESQIILEKFNKLLPVLVLLSNQSQEGAQEAFRQLQNGEQALTESMTEAAKLLDATKANHVKDALDHLMQRLHGAISRHPANISILVTSAAQMLQATQELSAAKSALEKNKQALANLQKELAELDQLDERVRREKGVEMTRLEEVLQ